MAKRKKQLPQCINNQPQALAYRYPQVENAKEALKDFSCISQWQRPNTLKLQQLLIITEKPSPSLQRLLQTLEGDEHVSTAIFEPYCTTVEGCDVSLLDDKFKRYTPDVVLIDLDGCPQTLHTPEALGALCQRIRHLGFTITGYRAVLLVLDCPEDGPSSEMQRLQALGGGADDLLTGHLSLEELSTRLGAHLRRHLDTQYVLVSCLPNHQALYRQVARAIGIAPQLATEVSFIGIHLEGFNIYKTHYGETLANKLLEQLAVVFGQLIPPQDRVFHHSEASFTVITTTKRAERLAQVLSNRLLTVLKKAYATADWDLGFHCDTVGDTKVYRKLPLLRVGLSVCPLTPEKIESLKRIQSPKPAEILLIAEITQLAVYASLQSNKQTAVILTDMQRLTSQEHLTTLAETQKQHPEKPMVVVFEPDATLAFLLQTTLSFQGYDVACVASVEEAISIANRTPVALWILDFEESNTGTPWQHQLARLRWNTSCPTLVTSHFIEAEEALKSGADAFIPKPFNLATLLAEVGYWIETMASAKLT
jgi:DNA-binding response OmpR family regulator